MKKILSLLLVMAGMAISASAATVDYVVNGTGLAKYNGKKFVVRPVSLGEAQPLDSAVVTNGKFVMKGKIEAPRLCTIFSTDPSLPLRANVVVGDDQPATVTVSDKGELTVTGGSRQALFGLYDQQFAQAAIPSHEELNQKYTEYSQATTTPERRAELELELNGVQERQRALLKNFAIDHCDNVVGAYFFAQSYTYFTKDELQQVFSRMTPEFSNDPLAVKPIATLKAAALREAGRQYTDFAMADTSGVERKLSDYIGAGKYVLVDFWASWCGPCRAEMPNVKALYAKYHDRGFEVVGVSLDNRRDSWLKAIKQMSLPWPQLSDLKGWDCVAANLYGVDGIPCTLLIGPDGKIIGDKLRGEALAQTLARLFPE